ncbi:ZIP family metal transporter [Guyparkeria sp. SCN-R1]|uniref:ZIP family metal transporter n=1 Tax=Guyparkeria sp. SCN-R1 TaxID=2341113 RepID=UPI000F64B901|nr:ZIP family metal transporter [Guyparkeria sp. SCN-R1]RRQ23627.1 ZIP family metal transporter [Guyparkeria sp. SCN-R1]
MIDWFLTPIDAFVSASPVVQALIATLFTWGMTAAGALPVFFTDRENRRLLDVLLGFTGGVMIAASFWSLLAPSIEMAADLSVPAWFPAAVGFALGAVFLRGADLILPHLHLNAPMHEAEGMPTTWRRTTLLVLAITLHNIPEGLAIGVAFGALAYGFDNASLGAAVALAIGIGIQNFPEGMAVAMPLRREGMSRRKSFWYGQLSGVVEPIAGVIGAAAVLFWQPILPYALAFAAGAMIFVVVEEVIPEAQRSGHADAATLGVVGGFIVMMVLDVALS